MITFSLFTHVPNAERQILTGTETVRGVTTDFNFELTNVGRSPFSGGVITQVAFHAIAYSLVSYYSLDTVIPPLQPSEKKEITVKGFSPAFDGAAWLVLLLKANDDKPIKTYQFKGGEIAGTNEWRNSVYIQNQEMFNIYQVLRRMEKRKIPKKAVLAK
jgi:hypothetical protein